MWTTSTGYLGEATALSARLNKGQHPLAGGLWLSAETQMPRMLQDTLNFWTAIGRKCGGGN